MGHSAGGFSRFSSMTSTWRFGTIVTAQHGGRFAAMEHLTLRSVTSSPSSAPFDAHTRAWIEFYARHGGDTSVGTSLAQRLRNAGFMSRSLKCVGGMANPNHRWWEWWGRLIRDFGPKFLRDRSPFVQRMGNAAARLDCALAAAARVHLHPGVAPGDCRAGIDPIDRSVARQPGSAWAASDESPDTTGAN